MPKISREAGPSYFPEGVNIRATDDPALVAVARERGVTIVDPGDREPHQVLAHGERLDARHRAEDERNDAERRERESRSVDSDDPNSGSRAGSTEYDETRDATHGREAGTWTAARKRDEQQ